ncbi:uncharacterized protein EHS24_003584 [Apiotrichum porosum]|uniref:Xylose isomerase-like TIM barrel domain-containing protein n=1 Tax=Apiotrichum porosum TaxID=105984 RepID=A0A427XEJ0_9TREE|nr:uncharacterized protein EHS24_003584 [Apiotrichum porosum]RSH77275.1 hypothetical protein EHS24_003584 [Apiotrichum porosum]
MVTPGPHPIFSIASLSLGSCVHHTLPTKIRAAAKLGYDAIEIFIPDFEAFVTEVNTGDHADLFSNADWATVTDVKSLEMMCATAIGRLARKNQLKITCFQPFRQFEGFAGAADAVKAGQSLPPRLKVALDRGESYLRLMPAMKCDLLLVCSNLLPFDPEDFTTWELYRDDLVVAFAELGRIADKYGVNVGFEPLAWGTAVARWELVWEVVDLVNLDNVGIILDSFNCLGASWADPSQPDGRKAVPESELAENLDKLVKTIPPYKIFLYQIADAARPPSPIQGYKTFPSRMQWSRKMRVFPMEPEGYLPVQDFTRAILKMGYKGIWSLEVFNASLDGVEPEVVDNHGQRGIDGLRRLYAAVA